MCSMPDQLPAFCVSAGDDFTLDAMMETVKPVNYRLINPQSEEKPIIIVKMRKGQELKLKVRQGTST